MNSYQPGLQLTSGAPSHHGLAERAGLLLLAAGLLALLVAAFGPGSAHPLTFLLGGFGLLGAGALLYIIKAYGGESPGVRNSGVMFSSATTRGAAAWVIGAFLTGFYVLVYWFPETLVHLARTVDPLSMLLRGKPADHWFLYGTLYTLAVGVMGVRALLKYRHSRYQVIRTLSVIFFQLGFAFLIPAFLQLFGKPEFYFTYFWPLKYDYLFPGTVEYLVRDGGHLGVFMVFWGAVMIAVATPVLTYFYGKRWYCSWVCGCGGLAETAGDPYRHLSDKSLRAWKVERWMIHSVLLFIVLTTALVWINSATEGAMFGDLSGGFSKTYGFLIGAMFSGVIGVGFYPLLGARVWCRYGCPMAAILGILQKYFSRFRITANGGQCISCGNCSTYCEMGIDVRWYAQRGENIIRASCVGCGMCATVCPRGVLALENGPVRGRFERSGFVSVDAITVAGRDEA